VEMPHAALRSSPTHPSQLLPMGALSLTTLLRNTHWLNQRGIETEFILFSGHNSVAVYIRTVT
jgi:hypothetical protein